MGTLSGKLITELVTTGHLGIDPFDAGLAQPATYDLRLGPKILASPLGPDILGAIIELSDKSPSYRIQTGQMVAVLSLEKLVLPLDISGRFGVRSDYARLGIIAFGGVQLDPGFRGVLTINLQNVGPEPITVTLGDPIFTVEFQRLEEPSPIGYEGKHQDQYDFPPDQYDFVLSARTTSLAEIPRLRHQVERLNVLIEELEERLPDPDEGLELKPQVMTRLQRAVSMPNERLLSLDDMRKRFGL